MARAYLNFYVSLYEADHRRGGAMLKPEALAADNLPEDELRNGLSDVLAIRYRMNQGSGARDQLL